MTTPRPLKFKEHPEYPFFATEVTIDPDPRPVVDGTFYSIMTTRLGISSYLSIQNVIMNFLLLTFLFTAKEFRNWQFFPLMMQASVDIMGPGISNLIFEWLLNRQWPVIEDYLTDNVFLRRPLIKESYTMQTIYGIFPCFLMQLRCLLNEYSTGYCLLVTAFYRYLLVCHPTFKLGPSVYKAMALVLVSLPLLGITSSCLDIIWNPYLDNFYDYMIPVNR